MNALEAATRLQWMAAERFLDACAEVEDYAPEVQRDAAALYAAAREAYWCATEVPGRPLDFGGEP